MGNSIDEIFRVEKTNNVIAWNLKTPKEIVRSQSNSLKGFLIFIPIADLILLLLLTQINFVIFIIFFISHIILFFSTIIFLREYHRHNMRKKILKHVTMVEKSDNYSISSSEKNLIKLVRISKTNKRRIIPFILTIIFLILFIIIPSTNPGVKGFLIFLLLLPTHLANNFLVINEKIKHRINTRIDLGSHQITIKGVLTSKFVEKIDLRDIDEVNFVDFSNPGIKWRVFSIVIVTNNFKFPAGDFYAEYFAQDFEEIFSLLSKELNQIKFVTKTKEEYLSKNNKLTKLSARVFV